MQRGKFKQGILVAVISAVVAAGVFIFAAGMLEVICGTIYFPGMVTLMPLFQALPYKGWLVSLAHVVGAITLQNLAVWYFVSWAFATRARTSEI
jgi:hypothetical protein